MFDLVQAYVKEAYTEELQLEINRAFNLFDYFEYDTAYLKMIDIVMSESETSPDAMKDMLLRDISDKQDYVLNQHTIKLIDEATISQKNEILQALAQIQNLKDYSGLIRALETFESDDVQLSTVLAELCYLDATEIMSLFKEFDSTLLANLKSYMYAKENDENVVLNHKLIENLKAFSEAFPEETAGTQLVKDGILLGQSFMTYHVYAADAIKEMKPEQAALNILSLLYLSTDGYNSPILTYRKNSYKLFGNLDIVTKVEVHLLSMIAKVEELIKVKHEASRVS